MVTKGILVRNILILADLTSPLMLPRIKMLESLPYKKYILHNANNLTLSKEVLESYNGFIVLEHPEITNIRLRYLYSFFYTLFLLIRLNPKLIVVHWASRLYQNILLALWGKCVIVHTMGGEINKQEDCYGKKKFFTGILLRRARIITGKTEVMLEILLKNFPFVDSKKLKIISWGVESRFFTLTSKDQRKKLQMEKFGREFDFLFFSIRTFKPCHFHKEILECFIKEYGKSSRIAILVSTQECNMEYLNACKRELGLDRYPNIFFSKVSHSEMHMHLNMVDCVISYKLCDGISQSLMESVAVEKWVIANAIKNHAMLLQHKKNAYLLNSIEEMSEAFAYVQKYGIQKGEYAMLQRDIQQQYYLKILKEQFNV